MRPDKIQFIRNIDYLLTKNLAGNLSFPFTDRCDIVGWRGGVTDKQSRLISVLIV